MAAFYTFVGESHVPRSAIVSATSTPDRAAHPGAAEPAIAAGVLGEVLLVVVLGVEEVAGRHDLGRDAAEAGGAELRLIGLARAFGGLALRVVEVVDARAVLRADVVALAHPLRRIVALPERLQQRVVRHLLRIEHHEHDLVVAGHAGADFTVGRIRRVSGGVAHGRAVDTRQLPELALGAPEAPEPEHRLFEAGREAPSDRRAVDEMRIRHRHRLGTPGQRGVFRRQASLVEHR